MASVSPYQSKSGRRWRVQYSSPDGKRRQKRGFLTKREALAWAEDAGTAARRGEWTRSGRGVTVGDLGEVWVMSRAHLKPSSVAAITSSWKTHVKPRFGARRVGEVRMSEVQVWVGEMLAAGKSASVVHRAVGVLSAIFDYAAADKLVSGNPCKGVSLPRKKRGDKPILTIAQVEALAGAVPRHGVLVWLLATTGLRWGEAVGLRVRDIDFDAGRIFVRENAPTVGGKIVVGTPKTHQQRQVAAPGFVMELLREMVRGRRKKDWIFTGKDGQPLTTPSRRSWFYAGVTACQKVDPNFPYITPHGLRHTAVSLLVASGASVKVVSRQVGHSGAKMTLDVYTNLFPDELDAVAVAMDTLAGKSEPKVSQKRKIRAI